MYKTINFPEGTNTELATLCAIDMFDSSYEFNTSILNCSISEIRQDARRGHKPLNLQDVERLEYYGNEIKGGFIPSINVSSIKTLQSLKLADKQILVFEGTLDKLQNIYNYDNRDIVIYYPSGQPTAVLYNTYINKKIIPYGDVPIKLRVLKDGAWMDGNEPILYDGVEMNYKGSGLYEITKNILPRKRFNFPVTIGEYFIKSPDVSDSESIIYLGDNSGALQIVEGADILNYATDNSNGWFYDESNNGITNNDIGDSESTTLTLAIPSLSIDIVYGQSSEKIYDYMSVLDGNGNTLFSAKGVSGTDYKTTINNTSNTYVFKYRKDGSGSNGSDSCWINSITFTQLPDYPNN